MSDSHRRMKRIEPLVRVKEAQVNQEAVMLAHIRQEKADVVAALKESQRVYMDGVERLNRERVSVARDMLLTLEMSLDHVKQRWHDQFRQVQELERREEAQLAQLVLAQQSLKSFERLQDKYRKDFQTEMSKSEQKNLDEVALRRFIQQK